MTAYHRLDDDKFLVFAGSIIEHGKAEEFKPYQVILDRLQTETEDYNTKLQRARNRGKIEVEQKNIAKAALLLTLDEYALTISAAALRNPSIIIAAGFEYQSSGSHGNRVIELGPPYGLNVNLGKSSGEVLLSYQLEVPRLVVKNGVEWSDDQGKTWHNGTYFSGKKGIVKNLPIRKDLLLRVRSIGAYDRESDFSIPISTFLP